MTDVLILVLLAETIALVALAMYRRPIDWASDDEGPSQASRRPAAFASRADPASGARG